MSLILTKRTEVQVIFFVFIFQPFQRLMTTRYEFLDATSSPQRPAFCKPFLEFDLRSALYTKLDGFSSAWPFYIFSSSSLSLRTVFIVIRGWVQPAFFCFEPLGFNKEQLHGLTRFSALVVHHEAI